MKFNITIDTNDLVYECVSIEQRNDEKVFKKGEFYTYTDILDALIEHNYPMLDTDYRESDRHSMVMGANKKTKFSLNPNTDLEIAIAHPTESHNLYEFVLADDLIKEEINWRVAFDCLNKEFNSAI